MHPAQHTHLALPISACVLLLEVMQQGKGAAMLEHSIEGCWYKDPVAGVF